MRRLKPVDKKAVRLVVTDKVWVDVAEFDDDGDLLTANGTVTGDSGGTYHVSITPDGATCTCLFGQHNQHGTHSHDQALRLQAQRLHDEHPDATRPQEERNETNERQ